VFGVASLIMSLLFANIAASAYSDEAADMIKPFIGGLIDSALVEMTEKNIEHFPESNEYDDIPEFGTAFTALRHIGMPEPAAVRIAELVIGEEEPDGFLSDVISEKLSSALAYVAVFGIAFLLIAIVFAIAGNLIGFVFSLPGLKLIDIIAGIIFGFIKGFIIVLALAVIVRYFGLLASETIEETSILRYFINHNPIADLLRI